MAIDIFLQLLKILQIVIIVWPVVGLVVFLSCGLHWLFGVVVKVFGIDNLDDKTIEANMDKYLENLKTNMHHNVATFWMLFRWPEVVYWDNAMVKAAKKEYNI